MKYALGIDVSTTATKALLVDEAGQVVAVAAHEYGYDTPRPLWSEQDPELWWQGTLHSVRGALEQAGAQAVEIAAIGLTGQMHGLVLLDEDGKVLRPAILWNDQRTAAECEQIRQTVGRQRFLQITGNEALTGFTAPKILWVQKHEPQVFARAAHVLLPKDYVRYRLTGEYAMDVADGSGTVLMDLRQRTWSDEVLEALGIPRDWLPPLFEGSQVTGTLNSQSSRELGLLAGIPVVAGGGDQAAQAVGVGAIEAGLVAVTLGTSGVVFASTDVATIEPDGRLHAFCHAAPGKWHLMGVMLSAAGSLRWYRDTLAPGISFDELLIPAGEVPPGADSLSFLPYLTGERTPHPDPLARGAFTGLTVRHSRAHLTRAVLEGVAFGLKDCFELMLGAGLPPIRQVRISGGGARSPLWRQIISDVLGVELVTVSTTESAAFGAALLAGVGGELWDDVAQATGAAVREASSTRPQPETARAYTQAYDRYRALYPALSPIFHSIDPDGGSEDR
jgi:xylulokinase